MARISLRAVLDDTLIKKFQGLASGSKSSGQAIVASLKGKSSEVNIATGLRVGARTFGTAVQGLNTAITFLNTSKASLGELSKVTDEMINLADTASKSTTSSQERYEADLDFQRLGDKFQRIVKNSKLGDREILTVDGLSEFLKVVGLDEDSSQSIKAVFDKFKVPVGDDSLASEEAQGPRPAQIPRQAYSATAAFTADYENIFDEEATLRTRPNAYKLLGDLNALKDQIDGNVKALDNGIEVIGKNIDLVRATGLAFLDMSDQINSADTADQVASQLRQKINADVPGALAQAENLESIIVAALSLDLDKLGLSSN
jgi:flagellin-like hook-associated protein FlgL